MSFCKKVRRTVNAAKPAPKLDYRLECSDDAYTVYVVTQKYAEEHGWGGAGAIRVGGEAGTGYCMFKLNDTWPKSVSQEGCYSGSFVLSEARKHRAGNGAPMEDFILHELGGHEFLGWGHDVDNAVMNPDVRPSRSAYQYEDDRDVLRSVVLDNAYKIRVVRDRGPE